MLNRVTLSGRLTANPNYRQTPSGVAVVSMRIAVERNYKNHETGERESDFFNVTAWRGLADFAAAYLKKGSRIEIDGRLEQSTWVDQDGQKRQEVQVVAEQIFFVEHKKASVNPPSEQSSAEGAETDIPVDNNDPDGVPPIPVDEVDVP